MPPKSAREASRSNTLPEGGARRFLDRWTSSKADMDVAGPDGFGSPEEAQSLLRNFEESGRGWFWATDALGFLTYLSPPVLTLLKKEPPEILAQPFLNLFSGVEDEASQRTLPFILTKQSKFDDLPLQAATDGDEIWWSVSGRPFRDRAGNFAGYRGSGTDITNMRRSAQDTSKLATYDPLTGLLNRLQMSKLLDATLSAFKLQKRACAIMLIDLDRFKQVNDTLGHPAGDTLLKQVAERLVKTVGDKEKISRLGGDEFQIILPDVEDRSALGDLADKIIRNLSHPYSVGGFRCIIGASVGIAVSPFDGQSSEDLIRNADLALYAAKGGGRGRYRFYSSDLLQAAEERRILEHDLRDALAKNEMELAYQPIVDAKTNVVSGFEALLRWNHPERGLIPPSLFIPIAEEAGLISALGIWAMRRACDEAVKWPGKLKVAVNVSPVQFAAESFTKLIQNVLATSGLQPAQLELKLPKAYFFRILRTPTAYLPR